MVNDFLIPKESLKTFLIVYGNFVIVKKIKKQLGNSFCLISPEKTRWGRILTVLPQNVRKSGFLRSVCGIFSSTTSAKMY